MKDGRDEERMSVMAMFGHMTSFADHDSNTALATDSSHGGLCHQWSQLLKLWYFLRLQADLSWSRLSSLEVLLFFPETDTNEVWITWKSQASLPSLLCYLKMNVQLATDNTLAQIGFICCWDFVSNTSILPSLYTINNNPDKFAPCYGNGTKDGLSLNWLGLDFLQCWFNSL